MNSRPICIGQLVGIALLGIWCIQAQAQGVSNDFGPSADAAESDTVAYPLIAKDGTCPMLEYGDDSEPRDYRRALLLTRPRQIVLPEVRVHRDVDLTKELQDISLDFQQEVRVLRWDAGRMACHLVKFDTLRGPRCGWIARDALLAKNRDWPMQIRDLHRLGMGELFGSQSANSTLDAKVLVQNRFDKEGDGIGTSARVYHRLSDSEPYRTLLAYSVLKIFEIAMHDGERWLFVGGERLTEDGNIKQNLYGWVRADEVIPWSTRISVYFASEAQGEKIYQSSQQAAREGDWFAQQTKTSEPADNIIPRFPLLDTVPAPGGVWLHKIAFPGLACTKDGNCISANAYQGKRSGVAAEVWKADKIDFLFVIDASESMVRYFPLVVQSIREFLNDIEPDARKQMRFSIVVYGDFLSAESDSFQFARVIPFGNSGALGALDNLLKAKPFVDNMKDLPDAAFAALSKAIREANWRKRAGWRMVIWIGDHPNRVPEQTGNRPLAFTKQDVALALAEVGNGVWSAINVRGSYQRQYNELFIEQAGDILDLVDDYGFPPRRAYDADSIAETDAQVIASIRDNLHGVLFASKEVPRVLEMMAAGQSVPADALQQAGVPLAMSYIHNHLGLNDDEIGRLFQHSPLVMEGWVRQDPAAPGFRYWVSLKIDEIDDLINISEELCETLSDETPDFNRIKDAMIGILKGLTGDVPRLIGNEEPTVRAYLSKQLYLPVEHFSLLLAKDIDGFVDWYMKSPPREIQAFRTQVCKKATLMRLVRENKRVDGELDAIDFNPRLRIWQARDGSTRPFDWIWGTEHGIFYYSVPLDYML